MEIQTALNIVNGDPVSGDGPGFVYKPEYDFFAFDYSYRLQGAIGLTISMNAPSTDREDARRGFKKILEPLHTTFVIVVKNCKSDDDFLYEIMKVIIELETHEAREFLRKTGTYSAPFHPHRMDSMERYARYSGRNVNDDVNYGAYAPVPKSRRVDEMAGHVQRSAVPAQATAPVPTDAPRTVDNDGPAQRPYTVKDPKIFALNNDGPRTVDS
jgi:hypothetical protein